MCSMVNRQLDWLSSFLRVRIVGTSLVPLHIANDGTKGRVALQMRIAALLFDDMAERRHVRFVPIADIEAPLPDVRFTPKSRHR
jgi:hypothetical protein